MLLNKKWADYTDADKELLKQKVVSADENTPFAPMYAAAYLGKSLHTLQHMRCHQSDGIKYYKVGRHVLYRRKHLDEYLDRCSKSCTSHADKL